MASFQLKKNEDPDIQKTVAEDYANHKKVEYYFKIPHFHFLQATFSFLREKPVSQQKLLTVTLVNLNKLLTVTLVNFDSYSPL